MQYLIQTGFTPKVIVPKIVFKPGWYGGLPYLDIKPAGIDGMGIEHLYVIISKTAHDKSIVGDTIAMSTVPFGYKLVKKDAAED